MNNLQCRVIESVNRELHIAEMDSYQCHNCGEFSHHEPEIQTAPHGVPQFCPYCGGKSLEWRSDDTYMLIELHP